MAAPANQTPATATVLATLPASVTQPVADAGTTYTVWYAYTAVAGDVVLGLWGFGALTVYTPSTLVFEGLAAANAGTPRYLQTGSELGGVNKPVQFPVTVGQTYYFEFVRNSPTATPAVLTVSLQRAPDLPVPTGSFLINDDDLAAFPLAVLSSADGTNLGFRQPWAGGDTGAILPDGTSIFGHVVTSSVKVYSPALTLLATVNPFSGADPILCSSNRRDRFYVCDQHTGHVTTVTAVGTLGPTSWVLPSVTPKVSVIAPTLDDTVLYYFVSTAGNPLKRWDLVANLPLADFAAGVAGYFLTFDLLVLQDGTLLVGYQKNTATVDYLVRHYSAAGAILQTYPFGTTRLNRLAFALDDPASFWAWFLLPDSRCEFRQVRVSDGATLASVQTSLYNVGTYQPAANATPARFGHSQSCPFLVLAAGSTAPPPAQLSPLRRLRRAPHLSAEQTEQFFARFQLDLEAGVGTTTDPGMDPQVFLRWSDDGGHTWRPPLAVSAGTTGQFRRRAIWRRLGRSRDRVFEVSMSDPVKWALLAAALDAQKGSS